MIASELPSILTHTGAQGPLDVTQVLNRVKALIKAYDTELFPDGTVPNYELALRIKIEIDAAIKDVEAMIQAINSEGDQNAR